MKASFPRKTLIFAAALVALNLAGAHLLDALGLVEGLLSPSGGRLIYLVPLAVFFYAVRFLTLFVAPGLVVGALVLWALDARSDRDRHAAAPRDDLKPRFHHGDRESTEAPRR